MWRRLLHHFIFNHEYCAPQRCAAAAEIANQLIYEFEAQTARALQEAKWRDYAAIKTETGLEPFDVEVQFYGGSWLIDTVLADCPEHAVVQFICTNDCYEVEIIFFHVINGEGIDVLDSDSCRDDKSPWWNSFTVPQDWTFCQFDFTGHVCPACKGLGQVHNRSNPYKLNTCIQCLGIGFFRVKEPVNA